MPKRYARINWQDAPSTNTPRNALFFNKMDKGIDDIDTAVENQQAQIDQLVVSGDSSPAAAQAAVGTDGTTYGSLKSRLDTEHNNHAALLAEKASQVAINETNAELALKANKDEITGGIYPLAVAGWTYLYANLPVSSTSNKAGYLYCTDGDGTHGAGNYVSNGTTWYFGGTGDEGYNKLKKDLSNVPFCDNKVDCAYISTRSGWKNGVVSGVPSSYGSNYIPLTHVDHIKYTIRVRNNIDVVALFKADKSFLYAIPASGWDVIDSGEIDLSNYPLAEYVTFSAYSATGVGGINSSVTFSTKMYEAFNQNFNTNADDINTIYNNFSSVPFYDANVNCVYESTRLGWKNGVVSAIPSSFGTNYIPLRFVDFVNYSIYSRDKIDVWTLFDESKNYIASLQGIGWNTKNEGEIDLSYFPTAKYITFSAFSASDVVAINSNVSFTTSMYKEIKPDYTLKDYDEVLLDTPDGNRVVFNIPYRFQSNENIFIYVNGTKKFLNTDYTANKDSRYIKLLSAPNTGSVVGCHFQTKWNTSQAKLPLSDAVLSDGMTIEGTAKKYLEAVFNDFGLNTNQWMEMVTNPSNIEQSVMAFVAKAATTKVRCQCRIKNIASDILESTVDMYIPSASLQCLDSYTGAIDWFTVQEHWIPFGHQEPTYVTVTPGYRATLGICKNVGQNHLYFYLRCEDKLMNEDSGSADYGKAYFNVVKELDDRDNLVFPIPYDKWITLHTVVKCGSEKYGHYHLDVTVDSVNTVIFDSTIPSEPTVIANYPDAEKCVIGEATCLMKMYASTDVLNYVVSNSTSGEMRILWKDLSFTDQSVIN